MIQITANGKPKELPRPMMVSEFLEMLDINPQIVAVMLEKKVLNRKEFERTMIQDGDTIEVVRMIGGGQERGRGLCLCLM
ncbi:MAG: sulfur carrier protein ThiS [Anaerolineae bacterium]